MKQPNVSDNWPKQSLESLENHYWGTAPQGSSYLIISCHALRQKPLHQFEIEDLRIMVGQNIGLTYLIPMASDVLKVNLLASGDFYTGDLLFSVLSSDPCYWRNNVPEWEFICSYVEENKPMLKKLSIQDDTTKRVLIAFNEFETINK